MSLFDSGNFSVGCNYWASHAGTAMWRDWRPQVVERDFTLLESLKLDVVRVFPLWTEFQPLQLFSIGNNTPYQLRWKDGGPIPHEADGSQSGVDPEMLERFRFLCDCAQRHHLNLGVGLITGWMSGRLFTPPAFAQGKLLTDPMVLQWQLRFVHRFVREFRDHPAIAFWGVGNECNNLEKTNRHQGALWCRLIADAIRAEDPGHPLVAGMHGLTPQPVSSAQEDGNWSIQDMGEIFDVLTVHPYPLFSRFTSRDSLTSFKGPFHGAAEAHFYGDLGLRPCVAEEIGTLAPNVANEKTAAQYIRNTLWNLWAHDNLGLWWWCAFDQDALAAPPYEWCAVERLLGLFRNDGSPKPVAQEIARFRAMLDALPFSRLPAFQREAVCLLNQDHDAWEMAYGAWLLAKQAGFDLQFQFVDEPLRPARFYLLPGVSGLNNIPRPRLQELWEQVREKGAQLLYTFNGAAIAPFDTIFGLTSRGLEEFDGECRVSLPGEAAPLPFLSHARMLLESAGAQVLLREEDGNPFFTCHAYGKGKVWFLAASPEHQIAQTHGAWKLPYYQLYAQAAQDILAKRPLRSGDPEIATTIHPVPGEEGHAYAILVNHGEAPKKASLILGGGWKIHTRLHGDEQNIPPHGGVLLELTR